MVVSCVKSVPDNNICPTPVFNFFEEGEYTLISSVKTRYSLSFSGGPTDGYNWVTEYSREKEPDRFWTILNYNDIPALKKNFSELNYVVKNAAFVEGWKISVCDNTGKTFDFTLSQKYCIDGERILVLTSEQKTIEIPHTFIAKANFYIEEYIKNNKL